MIKLLLILVVLLTGCQAIGEHYQCLAEVDRQIPAQVQQRFIRTDTQCDANTTGFLGGGTTKTPGNVYMGNTTTNCTSTPIYETIVLNKVQRDAAFQQCISTASNYRIQKNNVVNPTPPIDPIRERRLYCIDKLGMSDLNKLHKCYEE